MSLLDIIRFIQSLWKFHSKDAVNLLSRQRKMFSVHWLLSVNHLIGGTTDAMCVVECLLVFLLTPQQYPDTVVSMR